MGQVCKQASSGIGVDLDQAGHLPGQVKIVAHHHRIVTGIKAGHLGKPGINLLTVLPVATQAIKEADQLDHALQGRPWQFDNGTTQVFVKFRHRDPRGCAVHF